MGALLTANDVELIRAELGAVLAPLSPNARVVFLSKELARVPDGRLAPDEDVRRAFLETLLVQHHGTADFRSGRNRLRRAEATFRKLTAGNQRLRRHLRNVLIVKGNHASRFFRHSEAIRYYREALASESDGDRRALAKLNIARIHLADGRLHLSLRELRALDPNRIKTESLRYGLVCAKVRVLLSLGLDASAVATIVTLREKDLKTLRNQTEFRYLAMVARDRFGEPRRFARRLQDFVAWVEKSGADQRTSAFYAAECLLLTRLIEGDFSGRVAYLNRLKHLTRSAGAASLFDVGRDVERLFASREGFEDRWGALFESLVGLESRAHTLTAQSVAYQLLRALLRRHRVDAALDLVGLVREQSDRLSSGLSLALQKRVAVAGVAAQMSGLLSSGASAAQGKDDSGWLGLVES